MKRLIKATFKVSKRFSTKMSLQVYFYLISICVTATFCAVFIENGGTRMCTLNNVGTAPSTNPAVKYPVYRKVCRQIVPTALGDQIEDDEDKEKESDNNSTKSAASQLRRAIIQRI